LRQKDPKITASRRLTFFCYQLVSIVPTTAMPNSQWDCLALLRTLGFLINPLSLQCKSTEEVAAAFAALQQKRDTLPYEIDGMVLKIDDLQLYPLLGQRSQAPRWAIAHKFPPEQVLTTVLAIENQVGRTGQITPVAVMQPVQVGGVQVSHASLYNWHELQQKDVRPQDKVRLQRAGDVIPQIIAVEKDLRSKDSQREQPPSHCPSCAAVLHWDALGILLRCRNRWDCIAQQQAALRHFVSRDAMNIEGLGKKVINQLFSEGLLKQPQNLYQLTIEQLEALPGFAKKSAEQLVAAIEKSKKTSFARFLYAVGIPNVGQQTAATLAELGSLSEIAAQTVESLQSLPDIGLVVATAIVDFFTDSRQQDIVKALIAAGCSWPDSSSELALKGPLVGRVFVLTGRLEGMSRSEAGARLMALGAKVKSAISKDVSDCIVGQEAGSKQKKAESLGIPCWDEAALQEILRPH
jgi:DNA ligase (NAD+)